MTVGDARAHYELLEIADGRRPDRDLETGIAASELDPRPTVTAPAPSQPRSLPYLDGLRGLAALLVYLSHYMVLIHGADHIAQYGYGYRGAYTWTALPFIRIFFAGGSAAVAIFFVLSGYVLTRSPLHMLGSGSSPALLYQRLAFAAIRRPFRLFIPVIGISFGFALCMHLPFGLAPKLSWPEPAPSVFAEIATWFRELVFYALNPFVKHGVTEHWFPYDPPVWTIAIEFTGSILVFALLILLSLVLPRWRAAVLIVTGLGFLWIYQWAMACFVAGLILAMNDSRTMDKGFPSESRKVAYNAIFLTGWWLLCQVSAGGVEAAESVPGWGWLLSILPSAYRSGEYFRFWDAIGAVLVVFATLRLDWLQKFFDLRSLRFLGRVSFSLYLIHIPLLWTVGDRIARAFGVVSANSGFQTWYDNLLYLPDVGPQGLSLRFIAVQLIMMPLSLWMANWGTILLDQPSILVGRWVEAKIRGVL